MGPRIAGHQIEEHRNLVERQAKREQHRPHQQNGDFDGSLDAGDLVRGHSLRIPDRLQGLRVRSAGSVARFALDSGLGGEDAGAGLEAQSPG